MPFYSTTPIVTHIDENKTEWFILRNNSECHLKDFGAFVKDSLGKEFRLQQNKKETNSIGQYLLTFEL